MVTPHPHQSLNPLPVTFAGRWEAVPRPISSRKRSGVQVTSAGMSKPLGPYSPIVRAGDFLIVSGQGGMADGVVVSGGVAAETTQAMANMAALLEAEGAALTDLVKTTCFLTDMDNFSTFNAAYSEALGTHRPSRSTVEVSALPAGFLVEVEGWAYVGG